MQGAVEACMASGTHAVKAAEDTDLPKALVKKIIKAKLTSLDTGKKSADPQKSQSEIQISKDALLACAESAKVFISYLTATANDICVAAKRQTISADDVLTALAESDFTDLLGHLRESLEAFKADNKEKSKAKAELNKKRKREKEEATRAATSGEPSSLDQPFASAGPGPSGSVPYQAALDPAQQISSRPQSAATLQSPALLPPSGAGNPGLIAFPGHLTGQIEHPFSLSPVGPAQGVVPGQGQGQGIMLPPEVAPEGLPQ